MKHRGRAPQGGSLSELHWDLGDRGLIGLQDELKKMQFPFCEPPTEPVATGPVVKDQWPL